MSNRGRNSKNKKSRIVRQTNKNIKLIQKLHFKIIIIIIKFIIFNNITKGNSKNPINLTNKLARIVTANIYEVNLTAVNNLLFKSNLKTKNNK